MDHVVSSLILSPSFFLDPLRPEAQGSLETCHVTFGCQRSVRRSKGGPGAHFMEMQKTRATQNIQQHHHHHDFFSESLEDVSGFGCTHQAAAQAEAFERTFPRRSKQQNPKFPMSKKIFPWMKESRHSNQKHGRRIAGLYDIKKQLFSNEAFSFMPHLTSSYS